LRIYPDRIVVAAEGAAVCEHQRIIERSHHGKGQHDEHAVLVAVERALQAGVASKTHILNLLHRLTDGATSQVPPIEAPQALVLAQEPKANVSRYDRLRPRQGGRHAS
jgi:hypothetical protein